ncbi:hypothetical protein C8J57DRAFT_1520705 [Mycena rebaudengoi]|nr:hypothetical protein C8J57DRAFT_1520705 [Mycena rebaudengoi]
MSFPRLTLRFSDPDLSLRTGLAAPASRSFHPHTSEPHLAVSALHEYLDRFPLLASIRHAPLRRPPPAPLSSSTATPPSQAISSLLSPLPPSPCHEPRIAAPATVRAISRLASQRAESPPLAAALCVWVRRVAKTRVGCAVAAFLPARTPSAGRCPRLASGLLSPSCESPFFFFSFILSLPLFLSKIRLAGRAHARCLPATLVPLSFVSATEPGCVSARHHTGCKATARLGLAPSTRLRGMWCARDGDARGHGKHMARGTQHRVRDFDAPAGLHASPRVRCHGALHLARSGASLAEASLEHHPYRLARAQPLRSEKNAPLRLAAKARVRARAQRAHSPDAAHDLAFLSRAARAGFPCASL